MLNYIRQRRDKRPCLWLTEEGKPQSCHGVKEDPDLADSLVMIEGWRTDYNRDRPHSLLGYLAPAEFKQDANRNLSLAVV